MNFYDLIRYHNEGENLDFKWEVYKDPKNSELIKDVLAFANAQTTGIHQNLQIHKEMLNICNLKLLII